MSQRHAREQQARSLLLHAAQSPARRAHGASVPPEQDRRRTLFKPRPGSGFGRHCLCARTAGLACAHDPQYRRPARERLPAARYFHAAHGEIHVAHARQRRHQPFRRFANKLHIVSPISMLGDLIPVMAGVAMAGRYLGQKIVAMTWIGDGGSSTGAFHEGLNFAAVAKGAAGARAREQSVGLFDSGCKTGSPSRSREPRPRLRHSRHGGGRQRCRGRLQCRQGGGRPMPRRPRPRAPRSENHAHEGPRAARSGRICPQGNVRLLEGAGSDRSLRKISHRQQALGRQEKI